MLRFVVRDGRPGGRTLVGLGLSRENLTRLENGDPILVRLDELDVQGRGKDRRIEVAIMFGETLQALSGELRAAGLPVPPVTAEPSDAR